MGKPILAISESHSSLRTIVESNDAGRWVELGDAAGLADCIRDMMHDHQQVEEMGQAARTLFERDYTLESCADKYAKILKMAEPRR